MSWSRTVRSRRAALLAPAAPLIALAACGFAPAYGPGSAASAFRGAIEAEEPRNDASFAFVARVEDRMGRAADPRYRLGYTIRTSQRGLAIDESDNITRYDVEGRLRWTLTDGDESVMTGDERAFVGYDAGDSALSTVEARRDATQRLMVILADRVVARLLAAG